MQFWDELEGKSLAGTYPLNRWIRTEGNAAWFATRFQEKPSIAYVVEMAGDDDPVVASLEAVGKVQHPNIVQIERVGRANLEGQAVAYAIQEPTEDNLSDALRERPLTTEETTQIVESLGSGLSALHAAGLLHGQVKATTVLAVGDTVKLRSDCVRKVAAADRDRPAVFQQDVSDFGALVFECLTQRRPAGADDPAIRTLPAPFANIVSNALAGRWGLADIAAALRKPTVESPKAPVTAAAGPPASTKAAPPPPIAPPAARPSVLSDNAPAKKSGGGVRIVALVAIAIVLGAVWYFVHGAQTKPVNSDTETAAAGSPSAGDKSAAPAPATPESSTPPAAPAAQPSADNPPPSAPAAAASSAVAAPAAGHKIWRVVVYTYGDQAKAQQRVGIILAAHPDLKPEVFTANGHGPYLVTIGGPVDHDEALNIRTHARHEGMAHDAYIQNYTH